MKIYFEDGKLRNLNQLPVNVDFVVNASDGVHAIYDLLDTINQDKNIVIYTNSILAFSNQYAWNPELQAPEIYIRAGEHMIFTRIDELTERVLREGHDLAKMYVAGEFGNYHKIL